MDGGGSLSVAVLKTLRSAGFFDHSIQVEVSFRGGRFSGFSSSAVILAVLSMSRANRFVVRL